MNRVDLQRVLEIVNGNWGIESASLTLIAVIYLYRSGRNLQFGWRNWIFDLPAAMQLAVAIATIAAGVMITRLTIWTWRAFYGGGDFTMILLVSLLVGSTIGSAGFLWAIVEIGVPLFGHAPWIVTVLAMAIFTAASLIFR